MTERYATQLEPKKYDYDKMIDCAAIKVEGGQVWTGHRHGHCIATMIQVGLKREAAKKWTQGFVTMSGRFVDREEAARIALASGQIKCPKKYLFSEDLY